VLADRFQDYERAFEHLANQDEDVLNRLGQMNYPIPKPLRAAASAYIDHHLVLEIARLERGEEDSLAPIEHLRDRGRAWGYLLETALIGNKVADAIRRTLEEIQPDADLASVVGRAALLLDACTLLEIKPDLWQAQNQFLGGFLNLATCSALDPELQQSFAELAIRLNISPSLLGWRP
jgi:hypothetical protein